VPDSKPKIVILSPFSTNLTARGITPLLSSRSLKSFCQMSPSAPDQGFNQHTMFFLKTKLTGFLNRVHFDSTEMTADHQAALMSIVVHSLDWLMTSKCVNIEELLIQDLNVGQSICG